MATTKDKLVKDEPRIPVLKDEVDPGHVKMVKGDDAIAVHPDAVKAHEGAGWRVA